ncbi:phage tail assembly protein [Tianweitania sediminis]|uniref:Phage tail assembly protein n=1 Tax=Tianweitania sediminis TaxID=1502156 RepID=A0A8J7UJ23_9HYPH|nr:phage tail assembly protein [Tianweitania sediminis]
MPKIHLSDSVEYGGKTYHHLQLRKPRLADYLLASRVESTDGRDLAVVATLASLADVPVEVIASLSMADTHRFLEAALPLVPARKT